MCWREIFVFLGSECLISIASWHKKVPKFEVGDVLCNHRNPTFLVYSRILDHICQPRNAEQGMLPSMLAGCLLFPIKVPFAEVEGQQSALFPGDSDTARPA